MGDENLTTVDIIFSSCSSFSFIDTFFNNDEIALVFRVGAVTCSCRRLGEGPYGSMHLRWRPRGSRGRLSIGPSPTSCLATPGQQECVPLPPCWLQLLGSSHIFSYCLHSVSTSFRKPSLICLIFNSSMPSHRPHYTHSVSWSVSQQWSILSAGLGLILLGAPSTLPQPGTQFVLSLLKAEASSMGCQ